MTRAALVLVAVLAACKPLPPRGNVPAEQATAPPRVVLQLDEGAPSVYLELAVAAGSAYDPVGQEGLANLVAHGIVEGGTADRSPDAVRDALYVTGNDVEVVVGKEWVTYRLRCHRDQRAACADLFADLVLEAAFDADVIARLRDEAVYQVTDGLRGDEEALAADALDAWIYEGHRYGHPVEGRAGVLPTLERDDVVAFHRSHYLRPAMVLGVAGAMGTDQVRALVDRFDALPDARPPALVLQQPLPVQDRRLLFVETGTDVVGFRLGAPTDLRRDDPDYPALLLAFTAFGAHRQSFGTLFREVRGKRGLNYGTYAYVEPFAERRDAAMPEQGVSRTLPLVHLWIRPTAPENAAFALKLTVAELERLVADGLDADTFADTRSYLLGSIPLLAQDPGRRLAYAVESVATGMPDPLRLLADRVAALTPEQVDDALRRRIDPSHLRIVGVGGGGEAVVAALTGHAPTPMTYAEGLRPDAAQAARDAEVAAADLGLADARVRPVDDLFR